MSDDEGKAPDQPDKTETAEKSGWKKVIEPIEKKSGYTGSDLADEAAPEGGPGVVQQQPVEQDKQTDA